MKKDTVLCQSKGLLQWMSLEEACEQYIKVLQCLHGSSFAIKVNDFRELLLTEGEVISFVVYQNRLVATAQASLMRTYPVFHAGVHNAVTLKEVEGLGFGRLAMSHLEEVIRLKWTGSPGALLVCLTNSPKKKNAGFYQSLGYTSRDEKSDNPTVAWEKKIGG